MRDPAYGLTLPLLTTKNGQKFGKSAGNAVGLDGSPIAFWQVSHRHLYTSSAADPCSSGTGSKTTTCWRTSKCSRSCLSHK